MGILFNIRKKLAEREITKAKAQARHNKISADQELQIRKLKAQAEIQRSEGLTTQEKDVLKQREDKSEMSRQRRAEIFKQARTNFINNSKSVGKFVAKKYKEANKQPRVRTKIVYVNPSTGAQYKPSVSRRRKKKRSTPGGSIFGM